MFDNLHSFELDEEDRRDDAITRMRSTSIKRNGQMEKEGLIYMQSVSKIQGLLMEPFVVFGTLR